jgi:hypothetical protein
MNFVRYLALSDFRYLSLALKIRLTVMATAFFWLRQPLVFAVLWRIVAKVL